MRNNILEEDEYRKTYQLLNKTGCAFEKAILTHQCTCKYAHKFCLAEREGIACQTQDRQQRCESFLQIIRQKALFALKSTQFQNKLPHAKEIKVQLGCLVGLSELLNSERDDLMADANDLLERAEKQYKTLDNLPYESLVRTIVKIKGRKPRRKQ